MNLPYEILYLILYRLSDKHLLKVFRLFKHNPHVLSTILYIFTRNSSLIGDFNSPQTLLYFELAKFNTKYNCNYTIPQYLIEFTKSQRSSVIDIFNQYVSTTTVLVKLRKLATSIRAVPYPNTNTPKLVLILDTNKLNPGSISRLTPATFTTICIEKTGDYGKVVVNKDYTCYQHLIVISPKVTIDKSINNCEELTINSFDITWPKERVTIKRRLIIKNSSLTDTFLERVIVPEIILVKCVVYFEPPKEVKLEECVKF